MKYDISPTPTDDEAAAIVAVMDQLLRDDPSETEAPSKWKMSGRDYDDSQDLSR